MGTPQAAVPTLEILLRSGHEVVAVYTQPDRPSGRGQRIAASPVKQFAVENGIAVFQPTALKSAEALETFKGHNADVAVVVAYGRILPGPFLTAFPKGAINVHFSLLPKYRGAAPVNWAVANGETVTGVTTMQMDSGLDTGDILLQRETSIGEAETAPELMKRLSETGAVLLSETLESYDRIAPRKQEDSAATYAPILAKSDGLIDWSLSARQICDRVRGFQPFPTSYTFRGGVRLTIWRAQEGTDVRVTASKPGTIVRVARDKFAVACGAGTAMEILELQPEGKRRMDAVEYLNGANLQVGEILSEST